MNWEVPRSACVYPDCTLKNLRVGSWNCMCQITFWVIPAFCFFYQDHFAKNRSVFCQHCSCFCFSIQLCRSVLSGWEDYSWQGVSVLLISRLKRWLLESASWSIRLGKKLSVDSSIQCCGSCSIMEVGVMEKEYDPRLCSWCLGAESVGILFWEAVAVKL